MKIKRIEVVRRICELTGIRRRAPDHQYLTKQELIRLLAHLEVMKERAPRGQP